MVRVLPWSVCDKAYRWDGPCFSCRCCGGVATLGSQPHVDLMRLWHSQGDWGVICCRYSLVHCLYWFPVGLRPFGSESVAQYLKKVLDQHNCTEDNLQPCSNCIFYTIRKWGLGSIVSLYPPKSKCHNVYLLINVITLRHEPVKCN